MRRLLVALSVMSIISLGAHPGWAAGPPKYAYTATLSAVGGNAVDPLTGAIGADVPGSPFQSSGSWASRVAADPSGRFVYGVDRIGDQIEGFRIDQATGTLTDVPGSPLPLGTDPTIGFYQPTYVTVDPMGRFVYVANSGGGASDGSASVSAYKMDPGTGALTPVPGSPFATLPDAVSVTVAPSGKFAYVATFWGELSAYRINPSTGALTQVAGSPFNASAGQQGFRDLAVAPSGKFLYTARFAPDSSVLAFAINQTTGALTAVAGSPFNVGSGAVSITTEPSGKFAYVSDYSAQSVWAFTINSTTGALAAVPGSPFAVGGATDHPTYVTVDPSGSYVYTVNFYVEDSIDYYSQSAFAIDHSSGALTAVAGSPFGLTGVEQMVIVGEAPTYCTPNYTVAPLPNTQSGNFNRTSEVCFMVESARPLFFNCSEMSGRTVTVNGTLYQSSACSSSAGKKVQLPASADGKYFFDVSAGNPSWSSIAFWNQN